MTLQTLTARVQARLSVYGAHAAAAMPFEAADFQLPGPVQQVSLSLHRLDVLLESVDLSALPGVPERAVRRRQLAFVAGRLCAERALTLAGVAVRRPLLRGKHGQPLWPPGWRGAISHTDDEAFAAVLPQTHASGLGIDAQPLIKHDALAAVLTQCMGDAERQLIAEQPDPPWAATVLFAAKEAGFKAIYARVRRFVDFTEYQLSHLDETEGRFELLPTVLTQPALPALEGWFKGQGGVVMASVALPPMGA
jgi:enterobactin synthetase component D